MTKEKAIICPKCKRSDLKFLPWLGIIYECKECGWRGSVGISKKKSRIKDINNHKV